MSEHTCHFGKRSDNRALSRIFFSKRCDDEVAASLPYQTIDCMDLMTHWKAHLAPKLFGKRSVEVQLERGEVNLFEAHQLARLTPERLGITEVGASAQRRKLLEAHLMALESGARLRARVKEMLGEVEEPSPTKTEALAVAKADELLEVDPADSTHLFYEELRRIGRAIRGIEAEGLSEEDFNSLMPLLDELSTVLHRIEVRQRPKALELRKVSV